MPQERSKIPEWMRQGDRIPFRLMIVGLQVSERRSPVFPGQAITSEARTAMPKSADAIERLPGICGGDACISGTRIPVWVLERSRQLGISIDDILEDYPSIAWKQLLAAWQYAEDHRAEIEKQIRENEDD